MKRDDKTPALGVPYVPRTTTEEEALLAGNEEIDPHFRIPMKGLHLVNAYWHEAAMLASEDPRPPTPDEARRAQELYEFGQKIMSMSPEEVLAERERRRSR